MNLPYGNDNWYVDPEYNVCNHGNGELVECNGTCMAAVGEGGRKFCYTECPNIIGSHLRKAGRCRFYHRRTLSN